MNDTALKIRFRSAFAAFALAALCVVGTVGCNNRVKVEGRVTFPDGTPLTIGQVVFTDDFYMAKSDLDKNGHYYLHSFSRRDGIERGTYKAYIVSSFRFDEKVPDPDALMSGTFEFEPAEQLIDNQHMCPDTSGWVVEVKKNMTKDFVVYPPWEVPDEARTETAREWFDRDKETYQGREEEPKKKRHYIGVL